MGGEILYRQYTADLTGKKTIVLKTIECLFGHVIQMDKLQYIEPFIKISVVALFSVHDVDDYDVRYTDDYFNVHAAKGCWFV